MSVDYYSCKHCGESRYEEYVGSCNKCGESICTSCLINNDVNSKYAYDYGYKFDSSNPELMKRYEEEGFDMSGYEDGDIIDDSGIDGKYCPFCSVDSINESELFNYIIKKYNLNKKKEWKEYKSNNNK